jgi:hypothetical protein
MTKPIIISGTKEEIPSRYLDDLMLLQQQSDREEYPMISPASIDYFRNDWTLTNFPGSESFYALAIIEEQVIGYGKIQWNTKYDNLDSGYFWVYVKKEERRKGYGTKILRKLLLSLPKQITRLKAVSYKDTPGQYFIVNLIPKISYQEIYSISDLTTFKLNEIKNEAAEEKRKVLTKGYDIIYIDQMEFPFSVYLPDFVKMVEEIWNDMPREELADEDEILTIDRFLKFQEKFILRGAHIFSYIAIHQKSGKPIGLTSSIIYKYQPTVAYQLDTGVLKEHRGNGLGYALKIQMVKKLLQDTNAKQWLTGNAGSNKHMLNINRRLGYKPAIKENVHEISVGDLLAKIE